MTTLTQKAMLVSLTVSQWQARKYDRLETAQLALKHGTADGIARVNKSLLGNAPSLAAIGKKTNAMRWAYYNASLPWGMEGVNVIKADAYMDFTRMIRDHMYEWKDLVRIFLNEYEDLVEKAKPILNGMYREEDYPSLGKVRAKFSCDIRFYPIAEKADWRVALSDEEMAELRKQTQDDANRNQTIAMKDAWARMHKLAEHAVGRLSDPKAVFRDSLVENARELCKAMTSLNILDDPNLEKIRRDIETALCSHNPDTLRQDPVVRSDAADKMKAIMDKMGAFYAPS